MLKLGRLVKEACEPRLPRMFAMPSSACCWQYAPTLLPSTLKIGFFVQDELEHRLILTVYYFCGKLFGAA